MSSGQSLFKLDPRNMDPVSVVGVPNIAGVRALGDSNYYYNYYGTVGSGQQNKYGSAWTEVMPSHYSGGGIVLELLHSHTANSGDFGWNLAVGSIGANTSISAQDYDTLVSVGGAVPATTAIFAITTVTIDAANTHGVAAGDFFRIYNFKVTSLGTDVVGASYLYKIYGYEK